MTAAGQDSIGPQFVLTVAGDIHGEDTPQNREIVRRIHACVNACDGFTTEELERGVIQDMRRVIGQVAPLLRERVQQRSGTVSPVKQPVVIHEARAATCPTRDAC